MHCSQGTCASKTGRWLGAACTLCSLVCCPMQCCMQLAGISACSPGQCTRQPANKQTCNYVACVGAVVADSFCQGQKPAMSSDCNTATVCSACPAYANGVCGTSAVCSKCSCRPQMGGGEFCGFTMYPVGNPGGSAPYGCNVIGAPYNKCCADQVIACLLGAATDCQMPQDSAFGVKHQRVVVCNVSRCGVTRPLLKQPHHTSTV